MKSLTFWRCGFSQKEFWLICFYPFNPSNPCLRAEALQRAGVCDALDFGWE
jgi:hypothetical protein